MGELKFQKQVGLFVALGLAVVGALLLAFGQRTTLFAASYEIRMRISNVGGLKERSTVFLAGVPIGTLKSVALAPDGRSVVLCLRILKKYRVHRDARFQVEQIGVLGDQFVSITPQDNAAPLLEDGDLVLGEESFSLQEAARSAGNLIKQLTETLADVRESVTNVKQSLLDRHSLAYLSNTIANFNRVSEQACRIADDVRGLVATNTAPISQSVSNVVRITGKVEATVEHLDEVVLTNRASVTSALSDLAEATATLKRIGDNLEAGRGAAGHLLMNDQLAEQVQITLSNLAYTSGRLSFVSSNLSKQGLFWKPRQERPKPSSTYTGKTAF